MPKCKHENTHTEESKAYVRNWIWYIYVSIVCDDCGETIGGYEKEE